METTQKKAASFKGIRSAGWVIVICFIIAVLIFNFVLGNPSNFMNNDPNNHPLPGNFLGTIYKGGFIVPVIQTLLLTVIALSIERYIAIRAAFGKGSLVRFVANIKAALAAGGSADSMALSQGISEALINTAFGILTGALAVISYNYYTNKIDKLTYSLDEVGFSIVQTFAATHK